LIDAEISELGKLANHLRRVYQRKVRKTNPNTFIREKTEAKAAQMELIKAIKRNKYQMWRELCGLIDRKPWGKLYNIVMGKRATTQPISDIFNPRRLDYIG